MSKISNPGDENVAVARWVIAPKSSKAIHSLTGESVDQLPEKVAKSPVVQSFVARGILVDLDAPPPVPVPERVLGKKQKMPVPEQEVTIKATDKADKKE